MTQNENKNDIVLAAQNIEPPFEISEQVKPQHIVDVYISRHIGPPHEYVELISRIRTAHPDDIIYLHLNTPGGYLDTGIQIINAMRDTKARVICVLDGTVCSMGSLIFLAAEEYVIHDHCRLMFHNYSGGTYGKGNEQIAQLESTGKWFNKMFLEICVPFLSEEECEGVIEGKDIWLDSDEVRARMERVITEMQVEIDEAEAEAIAAAEDEIVAQAKEIEAKRKAAKVAEREAKAKEAPAKVPAKTPARRNAKAADKK
ncbi:MAG: ATP-dependent Clp protease proteolytic subunit [Neptunomonas phycophila]|uniref:Clp protease ClpP n=1 Tax=Neptunomonas phycophila TaxID=1572645 RepID=UPI003B8D8A5C